MVVLAISYCWASKAHPDPDGRILKELCEFIKYLEPRGVEALPLDYYDKKNLSIVLN